MKVRVLFTGKTVDPWIRQGVELYAGRLRHYVSFELTELPDVRQTSSLSEEQIKVREGEVILKALRPGSSTSTERASRRWVGHGIWSGRSRIFRKIWSL